MKKRKGLGLGLWLNGFIETERTFFKIETSLRKASPKFYKVGFLKLRMPRSHNLVLHRTLFEKAFTEKVCKS
jgi:hypothetical protein